MIGCLTETTTCVVAATSLLVLNEIERYCDEMMREKFLHNMPSKKAMNKTLYIVRNQNVPR